MPFAKSLGCNGLRIVNGFLSGFLPGKNCRVDRILPAYGCSCVDSGS